MIHTKAFMQNDPYVDKEDTTSIATSSPRSSSPKPQPVYYVQSPSRDSHEEDKSSTSASATATQAATPVGSRSPSDALSLFSLFSRQSRSSSASRVSGLHGFRRKGSRTRRERARLLGLRHAMEKGLEEVEEEKDIYMNWWRDEEGEELSRSCKALLGMLVLGLVFLVACFVVWGVSKPFTAQVYLKKMLVNNFYFGEGSDLTGVPSKMLTINCSLRMSVYNPATFFGIHVSRSTINLRYYDLTIASGQLDTYYQPKQSWRDVNVNIEGSKVPLYGAGDSFVVSNNVNGVPLILEFEIRSRGNVVGKLVKVKHRQHLRCFLTISSYTTQIAKFVCV